MATPPAGSNLSRLTVVVLVTHADDPLEATLACVANSKAAGANVSTIVMDCAESPRMAGICRAQQAERLTPAIDLDLAAAWNEALAAVETDWVLCLEAGETMSPESLKAVVDFANGSADSASAYVLMVEIPASGGQTCDEQSAQVRLLPRLEALSFVGRVRPSLLPAIVHAELDLRHFSSRIVRGPRQYDQPLRNQRAKRDLELAERQLANEGKSAELFVAWGEALTTLGQHVAAHEKFQRALPLAAKGSTVMLEAYYGMLSSLDANPAARETQLATCLEALDLFPLDAQLLCGMGSYMLAQNRLDLAVRAYTIAVGHGQVDPQTWHLSEIAAVAASCLSLTQQMLGDEEAARATLEESLVRFPDSVRLRRQLLNVLIKQGAAEATMAEFNRLPVSLPMREALRCAVRGALLAGQRNWMAALPYLHTAYTAGCRDVICLRWLSVVLLSSGDVEAARPVLHEWRKIEPQNAELQTYLASIEQKPTPANDSLPTTVTPPVTEPAKKIRIDARKPDDSAPRSRSERMMPKFESVFNRDMPDSPASV